MSTPALTQDWLYPSHERVHAGLFSDFGPGHFESRLHTPLLHGLIALEYLSSDVIKSQTATLTLDIDEHHATLSASNFRNDYTGDSIQFRGIMLRKTTTGSDVEIAPDSGLVLDSVAVTVERSLPYKIIGKSNEELQVFTNPNHEVLRAWFEVAGVKLRDHLGMAQTATNLEAGGE